MLTRSVRRNYNIDKPAQYGQPAGPTLEFKWDDNDHTPLKPTSISFPFEYQSTFYVEVKYKGDSGVYHEKLETMVTEDVSYHDTLINHLSSYLDLHKHKQIEAFEKIKHYLKSLKITGETDIGGGSVVQCIVNGRLEYCLVVAKEDIGHLIDFECKSNKIKMLD